MQVGKSFFKFNEKMSLHTLLRFFHVIYISCKHVAYKRLFKMIYPFLSSSPYLKAFVNSFVQMPRIRRENIFALHKQIQLIVLIYQLICSDFSKNIFSDTLSNIKVLSSRVILFLNLNKKRQV